MPPIRVAGCRTASNEGATTLDTGENTTATPGDIIIDESAATAGLAEHAYHSIKCAIWPGLLAVGPTRCLPNGLPFLTTCQLRVQNHRRVQTEAKH